MIGITSPFNNRQSGLSSNGFAVSRTGWPSFTWLIAMTLIAIPLIAIPWCTKIHADDASVRSQVETAVSEYQQALGEADPDARLAGFQKAEIAFSTLLLRKEGNEQADFSPELYLNWGNAAIQIGKRGNAVLAYRKALSIDPFHSRAQNNLEYVRSQLPEWTQQTTKQSMSIQQLLFWNRWYSHDSIRLCMALLFCSGCFCFTAAVWLQQSWIRNLSIIPFVLWVLLLISQVFAPASKDHQAIVFIQPDTSVHTADSSNSPTRFSAVVPVGTEATATETRDEWTHVLFSDEREGWVRNSAIRWVHIRE